jgi:nucleoside-diphosphate-sugar epimerase
LETVSLRYFNVFGPRQDPGSQYSGVISRFLLALNRGESPVIYGDGEQSRDFTFVSNVVDANLRAAESSAAIGHVINIANGEAVTVNQLLATVQSLIERTDISAQYEPARRGDIRDSLADLTLAKSLLGYTPVVGLEEGLRKTIEWWKTSRFAQTTANA